MRAFDESMDNAIRERAKLERELRAAMAQIKRVEVEAFLGASLDEVLGPLPVVKEHWTTDEDRERDTYLPSEKTPA